MFVDLDLLLVLLVAQCCMPSGTHFEGSPLRTPDSGVRTEGKHMYKHHPIPERRQLQTGVYFSCFLALFSVMID